MRLLAILEALTVTGPAKNLIDFCGSEKRRQAGCEVSIAVFHRGGPPTDFMTAARAAGIEVLTIAEKSALDPHALTRLAALVRDRRPDIIQTHAIKSHFLVYLSRLWKQYPWIAFHHGYTATNFKMLAYNRLDRLSLRKPARILTVSRAFARQLTNTGVVESRITVLQNAVDAAWAGRVQAADGRMLRDQLGINPASKVLLAVGRLSLEKGHIHLVKAVQLMRDRGVPVELIVAGDGPERATLEAAASPAVHFAGQISDTAPFYKAADLLVLPSFTEGSPNVLLEAMAAGLPVVATAVGGIPEIVVHRQSALLVPAGSTAALADASCELLANRELSGALVACSRELIATRHSPEARAATLLKIYQDLAGSEVRRKTL